MRNILGHNTNKSLSSAYGDKIVCTGHQIFLTTDFDNIQLRYKLTQSAAAHCSCILGTVYYLSELCPIIRSSRL